MAEIPQNNEITSLIGLQATVTVIVQVSWVRAERARTRWLSRFSRRGLTGSGPGHSSPGHYYCPDCQRGGGWKPFIDLLILIMSRSAGVSYVIGPLTPVVGDEEWTSPLTLRTITVIYISNHQKYFQSWCWGQEGWLEVRQDNKAITKYLVAGRQGIMDCLITRPDRIQVAWLVFAALFKCRDCLSNLQTEPN